LIENVTVPDVAGMKTTRVSTPVSVPALVKPVNVVEVALGVPAVPAIAVPSDMLEVTEPNVAAVAARPARSFTVIVMVACSPAL